ncbi:MAG TPA: UPF0182 family protein [Balneolaceae bacterium]|nr:UPF0182 family protein [Balneolaceae bacterium]
MSSKLFKTFLIIAIPLFLLSITSGWIFEWLWLNELGYASVFWVLKSTQFILIISAFLVAALYFVYNFRVLASELQYVNLQGSGPFQGLEINMNSLDSAKRMKQIFTVAGLILAFLLSLSVMIRWDESLRFISSVEFGATDPLFGRDISFYLLRLPFWDVLQSSLVSIVFITVAILLLAYIFSGLLTILSFTEFRAKPEVLNHLSVNIGIWVLLLGWGFYLDRFKILLNPHGLVTGATYTDVAIHIPALWILVILSGILGVLLIAIRWTRSYLKYVPVMGALLIAVAILGRFILPNLAQQFSVDPNELRLEAPYLENNIEMTRLAYNLQDARVVEYIPTDRLNIRDIRNNQDAVDNIRLWDPRLLIGAYKQLQEIRSYYEFYTIDNDRYMIDGEVKQMMLSAREIARQLPSQSDTWTNRHMQYTHGYGLVMNAVTETNRQGEPVLTVRNLPPVYDSDDLYVENPAIYYGENSSGYYIVNTQIEELHYPDGDENVYVHYDGRGGIQISNFFLKALFAWELNDINILLSNEITNESRLQIWRSVQERIRKITPFLELDNDPYLVMNNGRLYWMQDAYTTSAYFPYAEYYHPRFNYIRNSVKIVVDAYHGEVNYYVMDEQDPVLQVYRQLLPDLFQSIDELPEGMEEHFRYPQDLFEIQIEAYSRYHMTRPQVFYNQEDLWARPIEKYGGRQQIMEPYYVLARLPEEEQLEFMLISPLTPDNRDNMIAWIAAKSDPENYGELVVFKLPKERLIYGPAQIDARIDQDPEISRQIALWDQRGSRVIRGNLMIIPIEDSFLYVEPVFLIADGVEIPQLQRVIVSIGDHISMQPTIEQAIFDMFGDNPDFTLPAGVLPETITLSSEEFPVIPEDLPAQVSSSQLTELRSLWEDLTRSATDGDWVRFGELMQEIDNMIDEE